MKTTKWFKGFDGYHNTYCLGGEMGNHTACISVTSLDSYYKYVVSFSYYAVKDNLSKGRKFHTLSEAKAYALKIVSEV